METISQNKKMNMTARILLGAIPLLLQGLIYLLSGIIPKPLFPEPFCPKIPLIDDQIPVVPFFILPYVWAFVFWVFSPSVFLKCGRKHFYNCMAAYTVCFLISNAVFWIAPTFMDRVSEGTWGTTETGLFRFIMHVTFFFDGREHGYNLCPSLHCIYSTISLLGVTGKKEIPLWYRIYAFFTASMICASTMFIKQHYFLDVITGISLGTAAYFICCKTAAGDYLETLLHKLCQKFRISFELP